MAQREKRSQFYRTRPHRNKIRQGKCGTNEKLITLKSELDFIFHAVSVAYHYAASAMYLKGASLLQHVLANK